uniref:Uncharacterized protein n=1 Tax=Tanacetum cinerariifolium TaxID=118510 RepID=A0A6L2LFU7_TANCI|nr:hypothetical protein [Tanacetum cinerariifolium]
MNEDMGIMPTKVELTLEQSQQGVSDDVLVLVSCKEEEDLPLSLAMDAAIRIFKRVNGFPKNEGTIIKSIQENTGCPMQVLSGEAIKVLKALEVVIGHLRKFLVDRSNVAAAAAAPQEQQVETSWANKPMMHTAGSQLGLGGADYALPMRRETVFLDRKPPQR